LQHLARLAAQTVPDARPQDLRDWLGRFQFGGELAEQAVGTLSGGERARLLLALLVWQRPNVLLLDEPTNHLDLATREALALALQDFGGAMLLVSHDRALLRAVCDGYWLVADGGVVDFDGDLDDYQRWVLERARARQRDAAAPAASDASRREQRRAAAASRQQRAAAQRPLRTEQAALEAELERLEAQRAHTDAELAAAATPAARRAELGRERKQLDARVAAAEERWLELGEALQALEDAVD
jgi:ATP-binding cassette subfamily F protein 3